MMESSHVELVRQWIVTHKVIMSYKSSLSHISSKQEVKYNAYTKGEGMGLDYAPTPKTQLINQQ